MHIGSNSGLLLTGCVIPNTDTPQRPLKKKGWRKCYEWRTPGSFWGPLKNILKPVIGHSALHSCRLRAPGQRKPHKAVPGGSRVAPLGEQEQAELHGAGIQELLGYSPISSSYVNSLQIRTWDFRAQRANEWPSWQLVKTFISYVLDKATAPKAVCQSKEKKLAWFFVLLNLHSKCRVPWCSE